MNTPFNFKTSKHQMIKKLQQMHAVDIAKLFVDSTDEEKKQIVHYLPSNSVDDVFTSLDAYFAYAFFTLLSAEKKTVLLTDLSSADLKDLFILFDEEQKEHFLNLLNPKKKKELNRLLKYDQTLAASEMRSDYLAIDVSMEVKEAMKYIIKEVEDNDYIDQIFVLEEGLLYGAINIKDLIIARKETLIKELVKHDFPFVYENDKLSVAVDLISNYDINVLPVINEDNKLLGIISADDIYESVALEYEGNIDKFVAVGEFSEESSPYKRAKQRLPWLLVSIVLNLVIALFLAVFQDTIDSITALILFQPLILGMAGNIGTQAIAVTILALYKKTHQTKQQLKQHIKKEMIIGLLNAFLIAVLGFGLSFLFLQFSNFSMPNNIGPYILSITISISLFLSMFLSAMFGVFIPIILTKLKIDPALASGPVISTINDLVALVIYFGFATLIIMPLLT